MEVGEPARLNRFLQLIAGTCALSCPPALQLIARIPVHIARRAQRQTGYIGQQFQRIGRKNRSIRPERKRS